MKIRDVRNLYSSLMAMDAADGDTRASSVMRTLLGTPESPDLAIMESLRARVVTAEAALAASEADGALLRDQVREMESAIAADAGSFLVPNLYQGAGSLQNLVTDAGTGFMYPSNLPVMQSDVYVGRVSSIAQARVRYSDPDNGVTIENLDDAYYIPSTAFVDVMTVATAKRKTATPYHFNSGSGGADVAPSKLLLMPCDAYINGKTLTAAQGAGEMFIKFGWTQQTTKWADVAGLLKICAILPRSAETNETTAAGSLKYWATRLCSIIPVRRNVIWVSGAVGLLIQAVGAVSFDIESVAIFNPSRGELIT